MFCMLEWFLTFQRALGVTIFLNNEKKNFTSTFSALYALKQQFSPLRRKIGVKAPINFQDPSAGPDSHSLLL